MSVILKSTVDAAKASVTAYNEKNWDALRDVLTPGIVYDEVATARKTKGIDEVLTIWRGWAKATPDSMATFGREVVAGNTVVLELTWRGTQSGPLETPDRTIPASGKKFEVRACQVIEVTGDKVGSIRHYFDMATLLRQIGATA